MPMTRYIILLEGRTFLGKWQEETVAFLQENLKRLLESTELSPFGLEDGINLILQPAQVEEAIFSIEEKALERN